MIKFVTHSKSVKKVQHLCRPLWSEDGWCDGGGTSGVLLSGTATEVPVSERNSTAVAVRPNAFENSRALEASDVSLVMCLRLCRSDTYGCIVITAVFIQKEQ